MPGIEWTPLDEPGGELQLNCGTRVASEAPLSPAATEARAGASLAMAAAERRAQAARMALNRLQEAARGPDRVLTTKDLADLLNAVEGS